MKLSRAFLATASIAALLASSDAALASWNFTQGSGTTMFSIDSGTTPAGSSNCASNECNTQILIDNTGALFGVVGNALAIKPGTGATFVLGAGSAAIGSLTAGSAAIGTVNPSTIATWGLFAGQNAASPTNSGLVAGQFNTTPTTITSGNSSPLQLDNAGNLLVNIKAGGGSGGTSSSFGSAFPGTGTAIGLTNGTNMVAWSATSNYGTAPSAIAVPALNAYVTNTNANGAAAASAASPVTPSNLAIGAAAFTPAQVSVASTATSIAAARTGVAGTGRQAITVTNTTTTAVYLGGSGVTTSTGTLLPGVVGASATINTTAAVYGIVASGTATVTEFETY